MVLKTSESLIKLEMNTKKYPGKITNGYEEYYLTLFPVFMSCRDLGLSKEEHQSFIEDLKKQKLSLTQEELNAAYDSEREEYLLHFRIELL